MKRLILLLFIGVFLLTACDEFLDVKPMNQIIPESASEYEMILNHPDVRKVLEYPALMHDDAYIPDTVVISKIDGRNAYLWEKFITAPDKTDDQYKYLYKAINLANVVLAGIDEALDEENLKNKVKGQALATRACAHFYSVNIYGKHYNNETADTDLGVPLVTKSDIEAKHFRATVKEVYDQILSDLTKADDLLPLKPIYNYRPSKIGVWAFLSRVYLYMGEWEKAKQYGEMVLDEYSFLYDYNEIEGAADHNDRTIWSSSGIPKTEWRHAYTNKETIWHKEQIASSSSSIAYLYFSADWVAEVDTNDLTPEVDTKDLRYSVLTYTYKEIDNYFTYYAKGMRELSFGPSVPEVILNVAEAKARLGDKDGALALVNQLGVKRYMDFKNHTAADAQEALNIVKRERRIELAFKGHRLFDLKRYILLGEYNKTITRVREGVTYTLAPDSPRYVLPFAQDLLELNPNIVQNPR